MKPLITSSLPSKSKCLRTLRKVYPGAMFRREGTGFSLQYYPEGSRESQEICSLDRIATTEQVALVALVIAAFRSLGYETEWNPTVRQFEFTPIEGYVGPEKDLPVELDPDEPDPFKSEAVQ